MRRYETILIADVNLSNDEHQVLVERYKTVITDSKGIIVKTEEWGKRKLAYEINKQSRGNYVLIDYVSNTGAISELERNLKIDDKVLKFLTVKKNDSVDMQEIEKEITAAQAAKASEKLESLPDEPQEGAGNTVEENTLLENPKMNQNGAENQSESSQETVNQEEEKGENQ